MRNFWRCLAILIASTGFVSAQLFSQPVTFEVATLKAVPPPEGAGQYNINLGTIRNNIVTLTNVTLADALKFAYGISADAGIAGPEWIKSKLRRFDVVGQAAAGTPREQILVMLQALLAERLKLSAHVEQRELPFLALVVAKGGSKLVASGDETATAAGPMIPGRIVHPRMSMSTLVSLLSRFERETVLDKTGLAGFFQVDLRWDPREDRASAPGDDGLGDRPSIYAALAEVGLKLESRKGMLDVLVVDHAEQVPLEN